MIVRWRAGGPGVEWRLLNYWFVRQGGGMGLGFRNEGEGEGV